jgi:hypothetical protein
MYYQVRICCWNIFRLAVPLVFLFRENQIRVSGTNVETNNILMHALIAITVSITAQILPFVYIAILSVLSTGQQHYSQLKIILNAWCTFRR